MKYQLLPIIVTLFLLSSCVPTSPPTSSPHGGGHGQKMQPHRQLTLQDQSTDSEILFTVKENDITFTNYGISHTKEMHFIVVRDDLRHFSHLHPERNTEGVWHIPFTPIAGGAFWLYADFVDTDKNPYTIRFDRAYAGNPGAQDLRKNFDRVKTVDGYHFELKPDVANNEITFTYRITNSQRQPVTLEEYLGAMGHSVLISPSGDFIHTHPSDQTDTPLFKTSLPPDPFYRVFTQFKINGKVVTVDFDWQQ